MCINSGSFEDELAAVCSLYEKDFDKDMLQVHLNYFQNYIKKTDYAKKKSLFRPRFRGDSGSPFPPPHKLLERKRFSLNFKI